MNEYDDLFKDRKEDDIFYSKPRPAYDPNQDINYLNSENRINRIILLAYVGAMLLVGILSMFYTGQKYPDPDLINQSIYLVEEPVATISESTNPDYKYLIQMNGTFRNDNDFSLPRIWIQFDFLDAKGNTLTSQYYDSGRVDHNGTFAFQESFLTNDEITDYQYQYGFDESALFYILMNVAQISLVFFIAIFVDKTNFRKDWHTTKAHPGSFIGQVVSGFVLVYVVMILSQLLLRYVFGVGTTSDNEIMISSMFSADPLSLTLLFLLLCVFTPVVEELVYRKVIYNFFERKFGYVVAIISSGLIFGLMHVLSYGDFIQAIPYVLMGAVFGYVYYHAHKNIYVTIGVHFINNLISYLYYFALVMGISLSF